MMTLEERERRAYITGRTEEADALGAAIDGVNECVEQLEFELRTLDARLDEVLAERDALQEALDKA